MPHEISTLQRSTQKARGAPPISLWIKGRPGLFPLLPVLNCIAVQYMQEAGRE